MQENGTMDNKEILVITLSGEKLNREEWMKGNRSIAIKLGDWIAQYVKAPVVISVTDDGVIMIDYAINGTIQPSIKIYEGKIIWPRGSNYDMMMTFMTAK